MEESKKSSIKIFLIILSIVFICTVSYTIYSYFEHKKLTTAIEDEKLEIESNLDSMIIRYEDAISDNTSMANELSLERDKIMILRDSIKDLKASNYNVIRRYRKQISKLEKDNLELFEINEELALKNKVLSENLEEANKEVQSQIEKNQSLSSENQNLAEKVAIGSVLKVSSLKIISMREKSSGKLTETSRSRSTDAFRVNFVIENNKIAKIGDRNVYIQIVDNNGKSIGNAGELTLEDGKIIKYSDRSIVNYLKKDLPIISLIEVDNNNIKKGTYTVNIYIENLLRKSGKITLK